MKKVLALLLISVMAVTLLVGCGDPRFDDLDNFLNVEMTEVNANYEEIKAEVAKWSSYEEDPEYIASLKDNLLPVVEDSLTKLTNITPATEEVKAIKDKYVEMMEMYKEAFSGMLEAIETQNVEKLNAESEKLSKGVELLDEYNAALEALAAEVGAEIQY